jgi:hypothetical protein
MDELIKKVTERIVNIPHDFNNGNKSEITLLIEAGYFELYNQITENGLIEILKENLHSIDEWVQYSEDNRSSPAWYFKKNSNGNCFVGHLPEGEEFKEINTTDVFYACAVFIKRHIESIRITTSKATL